jgi:rod shape-determining protein MreC
VDFFIRHKTVVAFIGFTLFCIISLSVQSTTFTLTIEGVGSAILMPFQKAYSGFHDGVSRFWAGFTDLNVVREELQKTRKKIQYYESVADELTEIKNENQRLRQVLVLKERIEYKSVPAVIISKDPDNWFRTIIIDRGESDGIKINMPVIAYQGGIKAVVGKIIEVRGSISRVLPVISPDMKIGVKLQDSKYPGLLSGLTINSDLCVMDYISRTALINPGNLVVTSSQGGVFPPGLYVGNVIKITLHESNPYQRAIVKPVIDFNLLEEVFVILKDPDEVLNQIFEEQK